LVKVIKSPTELMQHRLARRGYGMEESKDLMQKRKGSPIYLKQRNLRESNVKDVKRFR
jgi:hypothetical protein